jgi:hypothetical protein
MAELTFQAAGETMERAADRTVEKLAEAAGEAARAPGFPRSPEALGWALKRVIPVLGDRWIRIVQSRRRAGIWVTIEP